jgi:NTE family protein
MRIGLALSGGGIRGVAHIGVIKALEEHNLEAIVVSGTSAGSIVGAMYCSGLSSDEMLEFVKKSNIYKSISFSWPLMGFASLNYLKERLLEVIPSDKFEDLSKPLYVAMTNISDGKLEVASEKGSVLDAVAASCAIPMIFEPIKLNGKLYVDGGVLKNLPATLINNRCDILIGVNLMPKILMSEDKLKNLTNIAARTFEMSIWRNQQDDIPLCDMHLEVRGIHKYHIFNVGKVEQIFEAGYNTAIKRMPEILELIETYQQFNNSSNS